MNTTWMNPGNLGLAGRTVVVTGAASGIGQRMAEQCSLAGMRVVAVDRNAEGLENTRARIESGDGEPLHSVVIADLQDEGVPPELEDRMAAAGVELLLHAAGIILRRDSIDDVTPDDFDRQVAINQRASWFVTRAFCRQLQARGSQGSAVLVSSVSGSLGLISGSWVYATTKAAVNAMVRGFAKTYSPEGIRVNAVAPGLVETPMVRGDVADTEIDRLIAAHVPMGRTAQPEEIARAALFLLSDHASYVTGVTLDVDGGWLRR